MGNNKKNTVVAALLVAVVVGGFFLWKKHSSRPTESTTKVPSAEFASMTQVSAVVPSKKRSRSKKKTPQAPPQAIAVSTPTPAPQEAVVDVSTEILANLPSAQEEVGNDPTVLQSRFQFQNEYYDNSGSPNTDVVTARVDGALNRKLALRMDLPYVFIVSDKNQTQPDQGWGDILIRGSGVFKKTPRAGFTGVCDLWFNTADAANLGSGKNSIGPGIAAALMNPIKNLLLSGFIQQKVSYSGDSSRSNINRTKLQVTFNDAVSERSWLMMEDYLYVNWEKDGQTANDLEFEAGRRLGDHWSVWIRPGVGLWGQSGSGGYNSYLQAGVRYIFGDLLRNKMLKELETMGKNAKVKWGK